MTHLPGFRLHLPASPNEALGLAAAHLMSKPAFAKLPFGEWTRILVGQINRRHCRFVMDGANRVRGFAGWALTSEAKAEAWIAGQAPLTGREARAGDCVVFNAWAADTPEIHRFMVRAFRELLADNGHVFFRRHYADGRTRSVRLGVTSAPTHRAADLAA